MQRPLGNYSESLVATLELRGKIPATAWKLNPCKGSDLLMTQRMMMMHMGVSSSGVNAE